MTDTATIRRRAEEAARLLADEGLQAVLTEIEEGAHRAFLASRGDPEALTAAFRKVEAVQTLRAALQARLDAALFADNREAKRGRHGQ